MGAISFKACEVKNLHHYDIIKKDPNRGCYQFINKANGQEMLVRELQLGRDAQSLPEMESLLQRAMMMQHDNIVALKGTASAYPRLLHRPGHGLSSLPVLVSASFAVRRKGLTTDV